jgi:serine/threonine-protein kinase RsbW
MGFTLHHTALTAHGVNGHGPHDPWAREKVCSSDGIEPVMERLAAEMTSAGYVPRDVFAVRLAAEEAVVNAIKHGHQGDTSKEVRVAFRVSAERVLVEVEDQGPGFRPEDVPDPLDPENLERACGRGVFLMRHYMSEVSYNDRGNRVTLCKRRS